MRCVKPIKEDNATPNTMDQDDTHVRRGAQVREIRATRAKERRLDALHQLKMKKTKARVQQKAEGETQCQCVKSDMT